MAVLGNSITIAVDSAAVAMSKSCEIIRTCETIEVSSPGSGTEKTYIPGRKAWKVSVSYLVGNASDISDLLGQPGAVVSLSIMPTDAGPSSTGIVTFNAICTQAKITAARGSLVTGSWEFIGSSATAPVPQG